MAVTFRIPKLSDREIALALNRVRNDPVFNASNGFNLSASLPIIGGVQLQKENPDQTPEAKFAFDANSQVVSNFQLIHANGHQAFIMRRVPMESTDTAEVTDNWVNNSSAAAALAPLYMSLIALTRKELKAHDLEASLTGANDTAWNRYRDAQMSVTNSLQQATETLIINAAQKTAELDKARSERFEKLESDLRAQLDQERKTLQETEEQRIAAFHAKEKNLSDKEASFETKESHYVARQKQTEQIKQVQAWLNGWNLTKGTEAKRRPILYLYITALASLGLLTAIATWHSYEILDSADNIAKLSWWQWAALWAKSGVPLAAFITFLIYFIRWSGDWARQHSEEEFRNRTLLVDIGRASWLLEAVRDAQERDKEIPKELLQELSRNMFSISAKGGDDIHPQAISDLLLQGLSSVRLKAADGSEVEATRGKKK